jgi:hypothetical protein
MSEALILPKKGTIDHRPESQTSVRSGQPVVASFEPMLLTSPPAVQPLRRLVTVVVFECGRFPQWQVPFFKNAWPAVGARMLTSNGIAFAILSVQCRIGAESATEVIPVIRIRLVQLRHLLIHWLTPKDAGHKPIVLPTAKKLSSFPLVA